VHVQRGHQSGQPGGGSEHDEDAAEERTVGQQQPACGQDPGSGRDAVERLPDGEVEDVTKQSEGRCDRRLFRERRGRVVLDQRRTGDAQDCRGGSTEEDVSQRAD
jgi:hypothetical protein